MSNGKLYVKDSRTWKDYEIPITRNTINAADIQKIVGSADGQDAADRVHKGLRMFDPGFHHTISHESKITWV